MRDDAVDADRSTLDAALLQHLSPRLLTWSWCAYITAGDEDNEIQALGRTPDEAAARLLDELRAVHRTLDSSVGEIDPFLNESVTAYAAGGLVVVHAPDELAAFGRWTMLSRLSASEALRRWRLVFPAPAGSDPIAAEADRRAREDEQADQRFYFHDLTRGGS
jgi:hypothetical protein